MNLYETRRLVLSFLLLKQKKVSIFWCLINYFEIHLCLPWCLIKNVIFSIIKLAICGRLTSNLYFKNLTPSFSVKETFQLFAFSVTMQSHEWKSRRVGTYEDFVYLSIRLHSLMASKSICLALKPLMIHPLCETQGLLIWVCGASWMFMPKNV